MLRGLAVDASQAGIVGEMVLTEPPRGGGSLARISLSDSQRSENTINTHKYTIPYIVVQV
jgi:hypothetical protein